MEEETKKTGSSEESGDAQPDQQRLVDLGSAVSRSSRGNIYTLTIVGQVEGPPGPAGQRQDHQI